MTEKQKASLGWDQIALAGAVVAADRVTKILAPGLPADGVTLIPGVLGLRYAENKGMAFSMLAGKPFLLGILSLAVIVAAFLILRKKKLAPFPVTALMLMLGGAVGNMLDRFFTGFVPDMIEFLFVRFAIFNVADMALTVGCGLMILSLLFRKKDWENTDISAGK